MFAMMPAVSCQLRQKSFLAQSVSCSSSSLNTLTSSVDPKSSLMSLPTSLASVSSSLSLSSRLDVFSTLKFDVAGDVTLTSADEGPGTD